MNKKSSKGYKMRGSVQMAGAPGYPMTEREINDRLYEYGMQNTGSGRTIRKNIKAVKTKYNI